MADFPYTPQPQSVKRFLEHVQKAGVPEKVTQKYLEQVGFKSTNDRYIISVLKFLGFLDTAGVPTDLWIAYRNRTTAAVTLGNALRRAYADLFRTYPDAQRKDTEALRNYFSAHTKVAESTLALIVTTFKTLAGLATFDGGLPDEEVIPPGNDPPPSKLKPAEKDGKAVEVQARLVAGGSHPAININIQLQLPATSDADIYDKLFAALKKHLL